MITPPPPPDLRINGCDALELGVHMGEGFLTTLYEPLSLKQHITNESRVEHGKRIIITSDSRKFASREITLRFVITADTPEDLDGCKQEFLSEYVYKGAMTIQVPKISSDLFRLVYIGTAGDFAMNAQRTICELSLRFEEPNPADRIP